VYAQAALRDRAQHDTQKQFSGKQNSRMPCSIEVVVLQPVAACESFRLAARDEASALTLPQHFCAAASFRKKKA
jgi:hypothetical protein